MSTSDRYLRTTDLYLAAFLLLKGAALVNVDKEDPQKQVFVFETRPQSLLALSEWYRPEPCYVEIRSFRDALRISKDKLNARQFRG